MGYLSGMEKPTTWGDEFTMIATANSYGVRIHVLTSHEENWYMVYSPKGEVPSGARDLFGTGSLQLPVHSGLMPTGAESIGCCGRNGRCVSAGGQSIGRPDWGSTQVGFPYSSPL